MNTKSSAYDLVKSHASDIKVRLYTPAHQGGSGKAQYFGEQMYEYDLPFLTRNRTEGVEKYFSELYQTKQTFFLTGGATQGMLVACALLARKHRRVALGLNSHIAVIHGMVLSGLEPFLIPSKSVMPTAEEVIAALDGEGKNVDALVLTHPSYEGIVTDVGKIVEFCRERKIELVVDEAHGTHFPFMSPELDSVLVAGADVVVHSLHKYVGSFVQTALFHLPKGSQVTVDEAMRALSLLENTTRSNLLILSIEDSIKAAFGEEGRSGFLKAARNGDKLRGRMRDFGRVLSYDGRVRDPLKVFLQSDRSSAEEIGELLYQRGVDYEYADEKGVLLIFSYQHTEADFNYVGEVLADIHQVLSQKPEKIEVEEGYLTRKPAMQMLPKEAFFCRRETLPIEKALGRISSSCVKKVPPGSPILIPGEEVTEWHLQNISADTFIEVVA